jgi:hypothetical protein
MPNIQSDVRNVQLRIRDRRFGSTEFNVIQRVNLHFVDNVGCRDNEWRASSMQIFKELQASIGQLDGISPFTMLKCDANYYKAQVELGFLIPRSVNTPSTLLHSMSRTRPKPFPTTCLTSSYPMGTN